MGEGGESERESGRETTDDECFELVAPALATTPRLRAPDISPKGGSVPFAQRDNGNTSRWRETGGGGGRRAGRSGGRKVGRNKTRKTERVRQTAAANSSFVARLRHRHSTVRESV